MFVLVVDGDVRASVDADVHARVANLLFMLMLLTHVDSHIDNAHRTPRSANPSSLTLF